MRLGRTAEAGASLRRCLELDKKGGPPLGKEMLKTVTDLEKTASGNSTSKAITWASAYKGCGGCGAENVKLMMCGGCRLLGFCSEECQHLAWRLGHRKGCSKHPIPTCEEIQALTPSGKLA
jgi:hypothetical protein